MLVLTVEVDSRRKDRSPLDSFLQVAIFAGGDQASVGQLYLLQFVRPLVHLGGEHRLRIELPVCSRIHVDSVASLHGEVDPQLAGSAPEGLPNPQCQIRFDPSRQGRVTRCLPDARIAICVQAGNPSESR
jgi:hypothetical protein